MTVNRLTFNSRLLTVKSDLARAQKKLSEVSTEAMSGKKINNLYDAPQSIYEIFTLKNRASTIGIYSTTIGTARSSLDLSDGKISEAVELIHNMKELAIRSNNAGLTSSQMENNVQLLDDIADQMSAVANTKFGDRYIFSGSKTSTLPFIANPDELAMPDPADPDYSAKLTAYLASSPIAYQGNNTIVSTAVSDNQTVDMNVNGQEIFMGTDGGKNVFTVMKNLRYAMSTNDSTAIGTALDDLDTVLNQMMSARAEIGIQNQRLDAAELNIGNEEVRLMQRLSDIQDADISDVLTRLTTQQTALNIVFASATRVMESSAVSLFN